MKKVLLLLLFLCVLLMVVLVSAYFFVFKGSPTLEGIASFTEAFIKDPGVFMLSAIPGTEQNALMKESMNEKRSFDLQEDVLTTHEQFFSFVGSIDSVDSSDWMWSKDFFVGNVVGVDKEEQLLGVDFVLPEGKDNPAVVRAYCSSADTIVVSQNLDVVSESVDFFGNVKRGDTLYAYCLDADCIAVGKSCILIR
jgi:hypothetical protein